MAMPPKLGATVDSNHQSFSAHDWAATPIADAIYPALGRLFPTLARISLNRRQFSFYLPSFHPYIAGKFIYSTPYIYTTSDFDMPVGIILLKRMGHIRRQGNVQGA